MLLALQFSEHFIPTEPHSNDAAHAPNQIDWAFMDSQVGNSQLSSLRISTKTQK